MKINKRSIVDELAGSMSVPKSKRGVSFKRVRAIVQHRAAKKIVEDSLLKLRLLKF